MLIYPHNAFMLSVGFHLLAYCTVHCQHGYAPVHFVVLKKIIIIMLLYICHVYVKLDGALNSSGIYRTVQ